MNPSTEPRLFTHLALWAVALPIHYPIVLTCCLLLTHHTFIILHHGSKTVAAEQAF
jgi:hypothetical protein